MISSELIGRIRQIQIRARHAVDDALAGEYSSVFKGYGIEFEEVREYAPGDDVRSIDWNVTARSGTPFIKRFREERQLTVVFMVDLSASGSFGSGNRTKREIGAEICALIAFSAIRNNDRVGLILFTDSVELFIPALKGQTHALRIVRELLTFEPVGRGTDLDAAFEYLLRVFTRRSVVFVLSDFLAEDFSGTLAIAGRKHDLNAIRITDPHERGLPDVGLLSLKDAESGDIRLIDTSSPKVRREWSLRWARKLNEFEATCRRLRISYGEVSTAGDYVDSLLEFFARRNHERRIVQ